MKLLNNYQFIFMGELVQDQAPMGPSVFTFPAGSCFYPGVGKHTPGLACHNYRFGHQLCVWALATAPFGQPGGGWICWRCWTAMEGPDQRFL